MTTADYQHRLKSLRQTWAVWARTGSGLDADGWRRPTRCPGWDVAAVFAHVSMFPMALAGGIPPMPPNPGPTLDAASVLRGFNTPGGVAHTMAVTVAAAAVADATGYDPDDIVARFDATGPVALDGVAAADPSTLIAWPASGGVLPLHEALRIVLLESVVHLLDVQHALHQAPDVPAAALRDTAHLLADLPEPTAFIEAATGRSSTPVLPVLR